MIVAGVARELRRKPRKHCCCYYQSRCQSVTDCHGSSIAGTHALCARVPAQDSLACSSTSCACRVRRMYSEFGAPVGYKCPDSTRPFSRARTPPVAAAASAVPIASAQARRPSISGTRRRVVARKWREATRVTRRVTWCREPARDLHGLVAAAGATPLQQLIAGGRRCCCRSRCCCCWGRRCLDTDVMRSHAVA